MLETRDAWARIETTYDYAGWVQVSALSAERPGRWLPARREGDPVAEAREYLGAPYQWGGMTENGIDCSGLVHMAYRRLGTLVPRDARDQEAAGERAARPRRGDLVTYGQGPDADHIAFWLGNDRILHAVGSRGVVEEPEPVELRRTRRRFVRLAT